MPTINRERAHFDLIREVHPDLAEVARSAEFREWLARQPTVVRCAVIEGDAQAVILVLDRYRADVDLKCGEPFAAVKQQARTR